MLGHDLGQAGGGVGTDASGGRIDHRADAPQAQASRGR